MCGGDLEWQASPSVEYLQPKHRKSSQQPTSRQLFGKNCDSVGKRLTWLCYRVASLSHGPTDLATPEESIM